MMAPTDEETPLAAAAASPTPWAKRLGKGKATIALAIGLVAGAGVMATKNGTSKTTYNLSAPASCCACITSTDCPGGKYNPVGDCDNAGFYGPSPPFIEGGPGLTEEFCCSITQNGGYGSCPGKCAQTCPALHCKTMGNVSKLTGPVTGYVKECIKCENQCSSLVYVKGYAKLDNGRCYKKF